MVREVVGRIITGIAGLGFLATAYLHGTGYRGIVELAEQAPAGLDALVPALWLVFSFNLTVVGLIVALVVVKPTAISRLVLFVAALCPTSAAVLQSRFIGFIPPTGILLVLGGLTLVGALILPPTARMNGVTGGPTGR